MLELHHDQISATDHDRAEKGGTRGEARASSRGRTVASQQEFGCRDHRRHDAGYVLTHGNQGDACAGAAGAGQGTAAAGQVVGLQGAVTTTKKRS